MLRAISITVCSPRSGAVLFRRWPSLRVQGSWLHYWFVTNVDSSEESDKAPGEQAESWRKARFAEDSERGRGEKADWEGPLRHAQREQRSSLGSRTCCIRGVSQAEAFASCC